MSNERRDARVKFYAVVGIVVAVIAIVITWATWNHPTRFEYSAQKTVTEVGQCTRGSSDRQVCAVRLDGGNSIEVSRILMVGDKVYQRCYVKVERDPVTISDWCWHQIESRYRGDYKTARYEAEQYAKKLRE